MKNKAIIPIIIVLLLVGGVLLYQYWWLPKEKAKKEMPINSPETENQEEEEQEEEEEEEVVDEYEGWLIYTNDEYNYEFKYPKDAVVTRAKMSDFSLSDTEVEQGLTFEEVYEQYTGGICISLTYKTGYINISAPVNDEFKHVICGRTGVGACDIKDKSENLVINGKSYKAEGFEELCQNSNSAPLASHNETMVVTLGDKTRIEYGASPDETKTFADYLQIRNDILKIVKSYKPL